MRRGKPNDPGRRARILQATLDVIRADGIDAASYRGIAAHAGVPLGSMTYYFPTLEGLIVSALDTTRSDLEPRYADPLRQARTRADVVDVLVDAAIGATSPTIEDIRLYEEIRHYGARNPKIADVLQAVEDDSLVMLHRVLPHSTALAVNALLWGWWSHRLAHPDTALDELTVRQAFEALVHLPARGHPFHEKEQTVPETMRAIRLTGPVDLDGLIVSDVPIPEVRPGWVRIRVMAFGVNESEVTSRKGESSPDFTYPRILGIECVGTVDAVTDNSALEVGQQVATMMGGMGRAVDGSYAEYTLVREENIIPFSSDLPWGVLGALPEMFQTAYGSLHTGLALEPGQSILIRGGTSTVGLSAIALAHELGAHVIATTRNPARADLLRQLGADEVFVDNGSLAAEVRKTHPQGLDAALELVGLDVLPDTLRTLRRGGTGCFTGALSGVWTLENFSPFALIPNGVRLSRYAGQASDLPADDFATQLDAIAAGRISPAIAATYHGLAGVADAQQALESGHTPGKHVVTLA